MFQINKINYVYNVSSKLLFFMINRDGSLETFSDVYHSIISPISEKLSNVPDYYCKVTQ